MKDVEQIKRELQTFDIKYNTIDESLKAIKGNTLTELFNNISTYIDCYKITIEKTKEFNSIFNNKLVIEDGILLYNCTGLKTITIPNSVISIGSYAFYGCNKNLKIIKI